MVLSLAVPHQFLVDYSAVLWYNINKDKIVRIASKHGFADCFALNNIVKGCVSVVVNSV